MPQPHQSDLREGLWRTIFLSDTRAGKNFDIVLLWLIGISVGVVMLESIKELRQQFGTAFRLIEWAFTILFTIEYITRIAVSHRPLRYVFSFFGIVDLVSILPTYLTLISGDTHYLAVVRILRMLRMFRILKMARHMGEARILTNALRASWPKISVFIFGVMMLVCVMGTLLYLIEGNSDESQFSNIPKSIYWAIVTITTVGYGDITPQTAVGQLLSAVMMITGYAIIAVPTGIVGAELNRELRLDHRECPDCGSAGHLVSAKYCRDCGASLESSDESLKKTPPPD